MENHEGIVWRSTGSWYEVMHPNLGKIRCRLKGVFKTKGLKVTNPIAVGDHVKFQLETNHDEQGMITEILPRQNYIIRKSVHKTAHGHLIACNIDQAILVVTLTFPRTSLGFIDRFLVSSESFRIPAILVFNKKDILDEDELEQQDFLMRMYTDIGYECHSVSALKKENLEVIHRLLQDKTSLISGHSGVGKSKLISELIPGLELESSDVSTFANKGVHTTTFAEMYEVNKNSYLIDTPGIKELGLMDMEDDQISHYFPEMRAFLGECKFHNCKHINEPKCAVLNAIAQGYIPQSRYNSYLSMIQNDDNRR